MTNIAYTLTGKAASTARLAQSVERKALNLVVVGSSSTVGAFEFCCAHATELLLQLQLDTAST